MGIGSSKAEYTSFSTDQSGIPGLPDRRPPTNTVGITNRTPKSTPNYDEAWAPYLIEKGGLFNTYKITSGPDIKKIPGKGSGEIWGKYPKIYSKVLGFDSILFTPPQYLYVDDVRILCKCEDIRKRFYGSEGDGGDKLLKLKILSGEIIPACWEDYGSLKNIWGDKTFDVYVKHPQFYANIASDNPLVNAIAKFSTLGGRRTKKILSKKLKRKRKTSKK